ncbi:ras-responsive element-binding protein 1-like, partial [Clarias magur]
MANGKQMFLCSGSQLPAKTAPTFSNTHHPSSFISTELKPIQEPHGLWSKQNVIAGRANTCPCHSLLDAGAAMESALPEKRCVEDGKASQQQEKLSTPMEENPRGEPECPGGMGNENGTEEEREKEGADQEEEEDGEPCANSTAHSETNTGQMNGDAETPTSDTSPKTPSKSPSANRTGRRNQEMKDRSSFICPLCDKNCQTQHHLTMHIRQHNTEIGGNDHSCSICGKALSSASSLDRHMLVHSGERPYKCSVCGQTFTTNGNMH